MEPANNAWMNDMVLGNATKLLGQYMNRLLLCAVSVKDVVDLGSPDRMVVRSWQLVCCVRATPC